MHLKTISVLGCGWLGFPLAKKLVELGYQVKGSTTTPAKMEELSSAGIEPFLLSFPENKPKTALPNFLDADILVFNLPPSRSGTEAMPYEQILQKVLETAPSRLQNILFTSSTSVYPDLNREIVETDALASPNASSLLLRCEHLVHQARPGKATVVRLGGLMGGNRHPGRFLAGKTQVANPDAPVNMLHQADAVHVLIEILEQQKWGYTFHACAPLHPARKEFYTKAAELLNLEPPNFQEGVAPTYKIINSDFMRQEVGYTFIFPDPLACLTHPDF